MSGFTPGWYPDPQRPGTERWYDGTGWTAHERPIGSIPGAAGPTAAPVAVKSGLSSGALAAIIVGSVVAGTVLMVGSVLFLSALGSSSEVTANDAPAQAAQPQPEEIIGDSPPADAQTDDAQRLQETLTGELVSDYTCDEIMTRAVEISGESFTSATELLIKIRDLTLVENKQESFTLPTGADELVILACTGVGVYADGTTQNTSVELRIDSDADLFVYYEPIA